MDPVVYYLTTLVAFSFLILKKKGKILIPDLSLPLLFFILSFGFSVFYHSPFFPIAKTFGAIYHLYWWINGFILLIILRNINVSFEKEVYKLYFFLFSIALVIVLGSVSLFLAGIERIEMQTLVAKYIPGWGLLATAAGTDVFTMFRVDKMVIELPRVYFMAHPLVFANFLILVCPILLGISYLKKTKSSRVFLLFFFVISLFLTLSRVAIFSVIAISILGFYLWIIENFCKFSRIRRIIVTTFFFVFLPLVIYFSGFLRVLFFKLRINSAISRLEQYKKALELFIAHPFIGTGLFYDDPTIRLKIGTHSTYMEILMITGLLGFIFFIMFLFLIIGKWWIRYRESVNSRDKNFWRFYGFGMISLFFSITGSLMDFYPFFLVIFFVALGFLMKSKFE